MTDYVAEHSDAGKMFLPKMFQGFPEIKEALIANRMQAGFLVAPMAIALRSQGVPIKIVYLGHRYGSRVRGGQGRTRCSSVHDLVGKTIAIPSRFSDERLIVGRALEANGMSESDVKMVEMAPPDVASALNAGAIDAFVMGEPFPSQAETRRLRPRAVLREGVLARLHLVRARRARRRHRTRPEAVQMLVDGIARSGLWLDEGEPHREYAADFVGRYYYQQPPRC